VAHRLGADPRLAVSLGFPCGLRGPTPRAQRPATPETPCPPEDAASPCSQGWNCSLERSDARSSYELSEPLVTSPNATSSAMSGWRRPANRWAARFHLEDTDPRCLTLARTDLGRAAPPPGPGAQHTSRTSGLSPNLGPAAPCDRVLEVECHVPVTGKATGGGQAVRDSTSWPRPHANRQDLMTPRPEEGGTL
jgi:hypothetical protein